MKTGEKYCLYCLKTGNNIGRDSGKCSSDGVHKVVTKGEKGYRVRSKSSGFVFTFKYMPKEDFELVETITY